MGKVAAAVVGMRNSVASRPSSMRPENHKSIGLGLPKSESTSQGYEGQTVRSLQKRLLENCENRRQINTIRVVHGGPMSVEQPRSPPTRSNCVSARARTEDLSQLREIGVILQDRFLRSKSVSPEAVWNDPSLTSHDLLPKQQLGCDWSHRSF